MVSFTVAPPYQYPRRSWFLQTWFCIMSRSSQVNLIILVCWEDLNDPVLSSFCDYLPIWRGFGPWIEQTLIPFIQGWFVQSVIEIGWLVLEKIFKNSIFFFFSLFCYYLLLEKGILLHFKKLPSPSPKDDLCKVCLKLAQWFWGRSQKCEKWTDNGRTNRQQTTDIRKAHLSF
jgi:hypothetical protein